MHLRCQQEPEPTDFHESNENQAKEPFSLNYRSRARPKQKEFTKKFVMVLKILGWDRCLQKIIDIDEVLS
jgi:hypothetical protein